MGALLFFDINYSIFPQYTFTLFLMVGQIYANVLWINRLQTVGYVVNFTDMFFSDTSHTNKKHQHTDLKNLAPHVLFCFLYLLLSCTIIC